MSQFDGRAKARLVVSILVAALTVALVVTDWPAEWTGQFWTEHSMASGIVSGLVLFVLAAFVIEGWIEFRERQKTNRIKEVAYKVLAHVMRQEGQYLQALTTGRRPLKSPLVPVDQSLVKRCVRETKRIREDHDGPGLIQRLCRDERWRRSAHLMIRDLRLSSTAAISQWAPVMLQTPELTSDFNRVAGAIDALSPMQRLLNDSRVERYEAQGQVRDRDWQDEFAHRLSAAQVLSIAAAEGLHASIGDEVEVTSAQREWLTPEALSRLHASRW